MATILYLGAAGGTSQTRFDSIVELGHDVTLIDPGRALPANRFSRAWAFQTGSLGLSPLINDFVRARLDKRHFDLLIVDCGEFVGPSLLRELKQVAGRSVCFNLDNPFAGRDGHRFRLLLKSLRLYDLFLSPRQSSVDAAIALGATRAVRFWQAADERLKDLANHPTEAEKAPYRARVSFTGTWMEDRDRFLAGLRDRGVDVKINGPRWERSPRYRQLQPHVRGGYLQQQQFHAAIAASEISIGLLSEGNRDLHTTRSVEIPALGSLLVARRTPDHEALYADGVEAYFWDTEEECANIVTSLLASPQALERARAAGRARALVNDHFNLSLMRSVIEMALE